MKSAISLLTLLVGTAAPALAAEYTVKAPHAFHTMSGTFSVLRNYPKAGLQTAELSEAQAAGLRRQGFQVEINGRMHLFAAQPEMAVAQDWFLDAVQAPAANALSKGSGQDSTICLVDSGVNYNLPDLQGSVGGGVNLTGKGDSDDLMDSGTHGTAIASVAVGRGTSVVRGVAPSAMLYVVKVIDSSGSTSFATVAEGILSCIGHAQVVNLSLGSFTESEVVRTAVDKAIAAGLTVVAAAGNEPEDIGFPARHAPVIAVGSVDSDLKISDFSARGAELDFVAPGVRIGALQPDGTRRPLTGTSLAASIVSAVEAIRISRGKTKLLASDLGYPQDRQGEGLIDALVTAY